ncbi:uncharacterized protein LOC127789921 isoform X2 [Diospyros lotus]|uniref:uncharacterized protein LOC127789921 isoform X2 n=1 Tax=Diospyros lotus TaxID=55363 RepID=UPI002250D492|nr:uncharacterized protein LOC127789921 isoform X2 [Diospyros lotus]
MEGRFVPFQQQFGNEDEVVVQDHEDEDGDDDDDEDYEEEADYEDEEEGFVLAVESSRVSYGGPPESSQEAVIGHTRENAVEEDEDSTRRREGGEASSSQGGDKGGEWSRGDVDGLFCPICMEAWSNGGDHQVCCLPCGHLYGVSCIKRWLQQRKNSGKCPQCNRKCTLKDVRVIYASQIVVVDQELQKKVKSLEAKCASFEKKDSDWHKKEVEWQRREADLHLQVHQLTERTSHLEHLLRDTGSRSSRFPSASDICQEQATFGHNHKFEADGRGSSSCLLLQVDGAKFFDVDASSQALIIARRLSGMGAKHVLTKMSLIAPHERENIQVPDNTKAIRDIHVSAHGKLALVASLGKKLSVISTESNNVVISYDLLAAAWSCSWDLSCSHYAYTGLQNGMVMVFDMRQTVRPVESMVGLTCNPIHTVHSLSPELSFLSGVRSLLTASSVGLCHWNFGSSEERLFLVPESENQGICIALAYCPTSNNIVASFRPKVEMSSDIAVSQPSPSPTTSLTGQGVQGSHVLYRSVGSIRYKKLGSVCANVDSIRLPKSAIIDRGHGIQFVSGDEVACELVLQELPSFMVAQRLKYQKHPIRDVKYSRDLNSGLLTCLSEDILQLFSAKVL